MTSPSISKGRSPTSVVMVRTGARRAPRLSCGWSALAFALFAEAERLGASRATPRPSAFCRKFLRFAMIRNFSGKEGKGRTAGEPRSLRRGAQLIMSAASIVLGYAGVQDVHGGTSAVCYSQGGRAEDDGASREESRRVMRRGAELAGSAAVFVLERRLRALRGAEDRPRPAAQPEGSPEHIRWHPPRSWYAPALRHSTPQGRDTEQIRTRGLCRCAGSWRSVVGRLAARHGIPDHRHARLLTALRSSHGPGPGENQTLRTGPVSHDTPSRNSPQGTRRKEPSGQRGRWVCLSSARG